MPQSHRLIIGKPRGLKWADLSRPIIHPFVLSLYGGSNHYYANELSGTLEGFKNLATFGNGDIATLSGSTVYVWREQENSWCSLNARKTIHFGNGSSIIDAAGDDIRIAPLSIATSADNTILISGFQINDAQNPDANAPNKYKVWELWQDAVDQWRATALATGSRQAILLSSKTQPNLLVHDPADPYQLLPEGKGKLAFFAFAPTLPSDVAPFNFANISAIDRDHDGTILLGENVNRRVWRLGVDGKTLTQLAGHAGPRDERKTNPLEFALSPSSVAAAPGGAFFVVDDPNIHFVGPNDSLETELSVLVSEAEEFARKGDFSQAATRLAKLQALWNGETVGMRQLRARIAHETLKTRIAETGFKRIQRALEQSQAKEQAVPAPTLSAKPKVKKEKKPRGKHKFCCC